MPVFLRIAGFRIFIFSEEGKEPPHVHVTKGDGSAKLWLNPVRLVSSEAFKKQELRQIIRIVEGHEKELIKAWNETD
jgi:hypothetical protein